MIMNHNWDNSFFYRYKYIVFKNIIIVPVWKKIRQNYFRLTVLRIFIRCIFSQVWLWIRRALVRNVCFCVCKLVKVWAKTFLRIIGLGVCKGTSMKRSPDIHWALPQEKTRFPNVEWPVYLYKCPKEVWNVLGHLTTFSQF